MSWKTTKKGQVTYQGKMMGGLRLIVVARPKGATYQVVSQRVLASGTASSASEARREATSAAENISLGLVPGWARRAVSGALRSPPRGRPNPACTAATIRKAQEGDQRAVARIVGCYQGTVEKAVYARTRARFWSELDREDLVQNAWVKIFDRIGTYKTSEDGGFPAWAATVARNVVVDEQRRRKDKRAKELASEVPVDEGVYLGWGWRTWRPPTPERALASKELGEVFDRAVTSLPVCERVAFLAVDTKGLRGAEAAEWASTARVCPKCGRVKPAKLMKCEIDGTPLSKIKPACPQFKRTNTLSVAANRARAKVRDELKAQGLESSARGMSADKRATAVKAAPKKRTPSKRRSRVNPAPRTLTELRRELLRDGVKVEVSQSKYLDALYLHKIVVDKSSRGKGLGSGIMRQICGYADARKLTVALTPSTAFGGRRGPLVAFYKRFGFVQNRGRNKDYEISESMYRLPR